MGTEKTGKKPCTRCLVQDMDREQEYKKLQEYIDSMDEEIKVGTPEYRRRLLLCRQCDSLYQGICQKCGCFVEVRAVRIYGGCPHEEPRW